PGRKSGTVRTCSGRYEEDVGACFDYTWQGSNLQPKAALARGPREAGQGRSVGRGGRAPTEDGGNRPPGAGQEEQGADQGDEGQVDATEGQGLPARSLALRQHRTHG